MKGAVQFGGLFRYKLESTKAIEIVSLAVLTSDWFDQFGIWWMENTYTIIDAVSLLKYVNEIPIASNRYFVNGKTLSPKQKTCRYQFLPFALLLSPYFMVTYECLFAYIDSGNPLTSGLSKTISVGVEYCSNFFQ